MGWDMWTEGVGGRYTFYFHRRNVAAGAEETAEEDGDVGDFALGEYREILGVVSSLILSLVVGTV